MKKFSTAVIVFFALFTLAFSGAAMAQASIPDKIADQQHRIHAGFARGDLTHHEAEMLRGNLEYIRGQYEKALAEGTIRYERKRIDGMLNRNSLMIYKKRHNEVRRLY